MLTVPVLRNVKDYCGDFLSVDGPLVVHVNNGYKHGLCGNVGTDINQNWNTITEPTYIGQSGDSILFRVKITTHHLAFFELCNSPNIFEDFFRFNRLLRSNCDSTIEGNDVCKK